MARLVFGMNQSLNGYVDHLKFGPGPTLFHHFIEQVREQVGSIYGRGLYELMRYWDEDQPGQDEIGLDFGAAWRAQPKWVVSRTLQSVGPNATLVGDDLDGFVRALKTGYKGEIDVAGSELAGHLTELGLIDEYRLYLRPIVLGGGKPFFHGARPPLRLVASERIEDTIVLSYVPA